MTRPTLDQYFLQMLQVVASRATCARRKAGAILVSERGTLLSTGYNGVPRGLPHCTDIACPGADGEKGDTRDCFAVHAELNALLQCDRLDLARTIFISCSPCFECSKAIANTSITRVVCMEVYADERGLTILEEAGIEFVVCNLS